MPTYTYHCDNCDHEFEKYQSFSEDALTLCPNCSEEALHKVYKPALVLFKGSGYYVTDSKSHNPTMDTPSSKESSNNGHDSDHGHSHDHDHPHPHPHEAKPKSEKVEAKKPEKKEKKSSESAGASK